MKKNFVFRFLVTPSTCILSILIKRTRALTMPERSAFTFKTLIDATEIQTNTSQQLQARS